MKLLNFTTNNKRTGHSLTMSQTTYSFEDIQVKLDTDEEVTIEGYIDLDFDFNDLDERGRPDWYIDTCNVVVLKVWDKEDEEISLSKERLNQVKHEMQNDLDSNPIDNY